MLRIAILLGLIACQRPLCLRAQTDLRINGVLTPTHRNVRPGEVPVADQAQSTMAGAELLLRGTSAGIYARIMGAGFGQASQAGGDLDLLDVRLLLFPRQFTVEVGYVARSTAPNLSDEPSTDHLLRSGVRSTINLGPSGFWAVFAGGVSFHLEDEPTNAGSSSSTLKLRGWDGEVALMYQAPKRLPFFVSLGYRYSRYAWLVPNSDDGTDEWKEELSGITFALGVRYLK